MLPPISAYHPVLRCPLILVESRFLQSPIVGQSAPETSLKNNGLAHWFVDGSEI